MSLYYCTKAITKPLQKKQEELNDFLKQPNRCKGNYPTLDILIHGKVHKVPCDFSFLPFTMNESNDRLGIAFRKPRSAEYLNHLLYEGSTGFSKFKVSKIEQNKMIIDLVTKNGTKATINVPDDVIFANPQFVEWLRKLGQY
ncbi:MAG: hypothetical protein ACRC2Y_04360 [Aeromonas veronii]